MKPIKLTMNAFGPYGQSQVVDFKKLYENGLFLITGPTGAGKTTIFDGMTYALFGNINGPKDKVKGIRSHFAKEADFTSVEFEFEVKGNRYKIIRSPKQMVPKKRGKGLTESGPDIELHLPDGKVLTKGDDVNGKKIGMVQEILGIDADQFKKIIIIPQGEFREFLQSKSSEKEVILGRIFGTGKYGRITEELNKKFKDIETDRKGIDQALERIKSEISLENEIWDELKVTSDDEKIYDFLENEIVTLGNIVAKNIRKVKELQGTRDKVVEEKTTSKVINENFKKLETEQKKREKLEERREDIEGLRAREGRYKKAIKLIEEYTSLTNLRSAVETAKGEVKSKGKEIERKSEDNKENIEGYEVLKVEAGNKKISFEKLKGYKSDVKKYKEYFSKMGTAEKASKTAEGIYNESEGKIKEQEDIVDNFEKQLEEIDEKIAKRLELTLEKERIVSRKGVLSDIEKLDDDLNKKRNNIKKLRDDIEKIDIDKEGAKREYEESERLLDNSFAVKLGEELIEGEPCPVCGSTEHPSPVKAMEGEVTPEKVREEKEIYDKLAAKSIEKKTELNGEITNRDKLNETIGEKCSENSIEEWKKEQIRVIADLKELNRKIKLLPTEKDKKELKKKKEDEEKKLDPFKSKSKDLQSNWDEARRVFNELSGKVSSLKETLDLKKVNIDTYEQDLVEAEESWKALEIDEKRIKGIIDYIAEKKGELKVEKTKLEKNEGIAITSEEEFKNSLGNHGFEDEEKFVAAKNEDGEELSNKIKEYDDELRACNTEIGRLKKEVEGKVKVDLETFDERIGQLTKSIEGENTNKIGAINTKDSLRKSIKDMKKENKKVEETKEKYEVLRKLSKLSNGDTATKTKLETYVLAAYFSKVLEEANTRLKTMSGGRYSLHIREDVKDKRIQSGLDLEIYDIYTGRKRGVENISGGETFKASLALALGLSDVVQQEAGGIQLDSIFIDEGFGTLDDESLDQAMDVLVELQDTGRLVGIISHVNSLKERVSSQVRIEKGREGSVIRI